MVDAIGSLDETMITRHDGPVRKGESYPGTRVTVVPRPRVNEAPQP